METNCKTPDFIGILNLYSLLWILENLMTLYYNI